MVRGHGVLLPDPESFTADSPVPAAVVAQTSLIIDFNLQATLGSKVCRRISPLWLYDICRRYRVHVDDDERPKHNEPSSVVPLAALRQRRQDESLGSIEHQHTATLLYAVLNPIKANAKGAAKDPKGTYARYDKCPAKMSPR